jgi:hypothetical protein
MHQILSLLSLLDKRPTGNIPVNTPYGAVFRTQVQKVADQLGLQLNLRDLYPSLHIRASRGANSIPLVAWVAVTPIGKTVSTYHSVGICFDISGRGLVSGIMWSPLGPSSISQPIHHSAPKLRMKIDTPRPETSYSKKFIDPREWYREGFSSDDLVSHLSSCIDRVFSESLQK